MASVKPRGTNRWLLVWRAIDPATGQTAQRSKMFEGMHSDAIRAANEIEATQRREPVQSAQGITFARFLADWQDWRIKAGNVTTKTAYGDRQHVRVISDLIGSQQLTRLTGRDLDHFAAGLRQRGYAPITVHNTWSCAKKALRQTRRWKLIPGTPWEDATVHWFHRLRTWNLEDLVSPASGGGLWRPSRATAFVGHVARKHGLKTRLHNRRHAHAVLLMQSQVPIKVVASRLARPCRSGDDPESLSKKSTNT